MNLVVTRLKFEIWSLWHPQGTTPTQDFKNLDKQREINNVLLSRDLNSGFDVNAETCRFAVSNALQAGGLQEDQIPKSSLVLATPRSLEILSLLQVDGKKILHEIRRALVVSPLRVLRRRQQIVTIADRLRQLRRRYTGFAHAPPREAIGAVNP